MVPEVENNCNENNDSFITIVTEVTNLQLYQKLCAVEKQGNNIEEKVSFTNGKIKELDLIIRGDGDRRIGLIDKVKYLEAMNIIIFLKKYRIVLISAFVFGVIIATILGIVNLKEAIGIWVK